ncbi:MAG: tRNA 2-thiouridine(34) synthase MnmA [Bacteroidales bacterium]|nr:tRNA 2-thiouridine(34) synthase MnmA [Bacteroidales bacterium]
MAKIVVGLSGGVDSSVAAYLLKAQGHEVTALFMINWHDTEGTLSGDCPWHDDVIFAELVARKLGIPFKTVDLSKPYRARVVDYMFSEYEKGRTPNPDVLCNREVKFDVFMEEAFKLGAEYVATGHYCRKEVIETGNGNLYRLLAGTDPGKDQSYFLCQLNQEQLSKALFPIGHLLKTEVRRIAEEQGLVSSKKKDSQGICFIGKVDLPVFLQQKLRTQDGIILEVDAEDESYLPVITPEMSAEEKMKCWSKPYDFSRCKTRQVGKHNGCWFYTLGQRKGLQVGGREKPSFVIGIDVLHNIVYTGQGSDHRGLYHKALKIRNEEVHWIRPDLSIQPGDSLPCESRIRYRQPLQKATLYPTTEATYLVFEKSQKSITPGQFASWYCGEELVGSGVIDG